MTVYATFDARGLPTGFYPEDVFPSSDSDRFDEHGAPIGFWRNINIPADAVEISDADHQALIAAPGAAAWDGKAVVPYTPPPAPPAVRRASAFALLSALTADDRAAYPSLDGWDQRLFTARDTPWPENDPQIVRMAGGLKKDPAAWYDAALKLAAG